jgi:primary-amine oxidase
MRVLLWMVLAAAAGKAASNPLAPLSADEIRAAARIMKASVHLSSAPRFYFLALDEPSKEAVREGAPGPRRAAAVIYDPEANHTYAAIADLSTRRLASWKEIPGAQPPLGEQDSALADRIVRSDPRWSQALRERGIRNPNLVYTVAWPAGYFALPGEQQDRMVRVTPYYGGAGQNYFAHPIEGIAAHVDLTTGQVLDFLDTDRNVPVNQENADFGPEANRPLRPPPAPLDIVQSAGPGYRIENGEVQWQKWRFRYALTPREGLVLYTVGYEDGGRVRPVLYRASLSEMAVPYGDPGGAWFFRNTFDEGELGLGTMASTLRPGVDCPANCRVYDAVIATETGEPRTIPGAVALYEVDGGIAWKHGDETRRARNLVISYLTQAGNYEYGFEWIFHQDGTLESRVQLTGIMSVKGVRGQTGGAHAHLVAKNLAAVHHQHFFCFRLDMDVDGETNQVFELNSTSVPPGKDNPYGGAFVMQETPLKTELQAKRWINPETSRRWIVVNAAARNALGQPTGYALLPGENAAPFLLPDAWVRKRAGFLNAHLWVTPYQPSERYAAGDLPYQSRGADGLAAWTSSNRPVDNRDIVLWYTMGVTHNPRQEDWPVMPAYSAGFQLVPWGFFSKNPALDLPPAR